MDNFPDRIECFVIEAQARVEASLPTPYDEDFFNSSFFAFNPNAGFDNMPDFNQGLEHHYPLQAQGEVPNYGYDWENPYQGYEDAKFLDELKIQADQYGMSPLNLLLRQPLATQMNAIRIVNEIVCPKGVRYQHNGVEIEEIYFHVGKANESNLFEESAASPNDQITPSSADSEEGLEEYGLLMARDTIPASYMNTGTVKLSLEAESNEIVDQILKTFRCLSENEKSNPEPKIFCTAADEGRLVENATTSASNEMVGWLARRANGGLSKRTPLFHVPLEVGKSRPTPNQTELS
ncbi:hypothetical protein B0J14DRAFT_565331 [Halenospora varia]|nr:hypothetical protein B0J14DRAFT_565331 [Halenospora varia]